LQWSAVAKSGAQIIDGLKENMRLVHASALPQAHWTSEAGLVADSDLTLASSPVSPRRISAATLLSSQLSVQTSKGADELIAREIGRVLSMRLDRAALYGRGRAQFEPLGLLATPGVNSTPIGADAWFPHFATMRRMCIDDDAEPESYGLIFSPAGEEVLTQNTAFPSGDRSILASLLWPYEVSNQVSDDRCFSGCWAYLCICIWGAGVDMIVDNITQMHRGIITITSSLYCDVAVRFPSAFAFSEADSLGPPPPLSPFAGKGKKPGKGPEPGPAAEGPFR
jgi:hypothetical protein